MTIAAVRFKSAVIFAMGLGPALLHAQGVVHIEFPVTHEFATFVSSKLPDAMPRVLDEHVGTATQVQLPGSGDLYLWDREGGNVAVKPVSKLGSVWKVANKDFTLIGQVTVHVEYQGSPVQTAQVTLKDGIRSQTELVAVDSRGNADFSLVKPGDVLVTVKYRSAGADAPLVKQVFNLELQREAAEPVLRVAVPNETATASALPPKGDAPAVPVTPPVRTNSLGNLVVYLTGLAAAGYAGWWLYQRAKKDPQWVADRMKKLGVDLPQPAASAEPEDEPTPVMEPPKPKAPTKILLQDSEPTPLAGAQAPPASSDEPRLVQDTGEFSVISEGETVVGREDGLGLSLVGESSVSRRHAMLTRQGSALAVRDLQSTNGTYVNGRKVESETSVQIGDEIQFGAVRFRVQ